MNLSQIKFDKEVKALGCTLDPVELVTTNGDEIEEDDAFRIIPDAEKRCIETPTHYVVGGLAHDQDIESPFDSSDGMGEIHQAGTPEYYEALGLDSYGSLDFGVPEIDSYLEEAIDNFLKENHKVESYLGDALQLMRDEYDHSKLDVAAVILEAYHQEGWEHALSYIAEYFFDCSYWSEMLETEVARLGSLPELFSEESMTALWKKARQAGKLGSGILLDRYEHSNVAYSISGEGVRCPWDTSRCAAVWVPDDAVLGCVRAEAIEASGLGAVKYIGAVGSETDPCRAVFSLDKVVWHGADENLTWDQAIERVVAGHGLKVSELDVTEITKKRCRDILDTYNDFLNGNCYGVVIYVVDRETGERLDDEHEVWGFIGEEFAEQTLESEMLETLKTLMVH